MEDLASRPHPRMGAPAMYVAHNGDHLVGPFASAEDAVEHGDLCPVWPAGALDVAEAEERDIAAALVAQDDPETTDEPEQ